MGPRDYIVMPERWLPSGETLVRGDRRSLLLWGAIPGERAEVLVFDEDAHQDRGRFKAPAGPAHPARREPPCDRFDVCGACPLMHVVPSAGAQARLGLVRDALAEHGLAAHAPAQLVASPDGERDFRHIVRLSVGVSDQGHIRVGVPSRDGHRVVPIPDCLVVTRTLRDAMELVAHHVIELNIYPYDPEARRGLLRKVLLRQSRTTGEVLVTLIAGRKQPLFWDLAERLSAGLAAITGVHLHVNDDPGDSLFAPDGDGLVSAWRLNGKDTIDEALADIRVRIGPGDAYPSNPAVAERMALDLRDALAPDVRRPLVDLHCGVGAMTLAVGRAHPFKLGLEHSTNEIDRARENATLNRITAEFVAGPVPELLPDVARRLAGTAPVVLVDAGPAGLEPDMVAGIETLRPARLAIRCSNPRALARDLADLGARDWKVERVLAYDMFPQTARVELMALVSPAGPPAAERRAPRRMVVRS